MSPVFDSAVQRLCDVIFHNVVIFINVLLAKILC